MFNLIHLVAQNPDTTAVPLPVEIGTYVAGWLTVLLAAVTKFLTTGFLKVSGLYEKLSAFPKAVIALAVAFGVTAAAGWAAAHGVPAVPATLAEIPLWLGTVVTWLSAMGLHALVKLFPIPAALK